MYHLLSGESRFEVYFFVAFICIFTTGKDVSTASLFLGSCDGAFFTGNRLGYFVIKSVVSYHWAIGHADLYFKWSVAC